MTQTNETPLFIADHAEVVTAKVFGDQVTSIEVKAGPPAHQATTATVHLSQHTAEYVLASLAAQLGYTLVGPEKRAELGRQFTKAITEAEDYKTAVLEQGRPFSLADMSAMTDKLRDLRAALRYADLAVY